MTRRGPDRTMRHAQRRSHGLVPGGVAVHQLVTVEVVLGVAALVPALEEVGVEGNEQAAARILALQGEYVLRLLVELAAVVAVLHPDVVAEDDDLPERLLVVELQRDLLAELAQLREVRDAGLDLAVERQRRDFRRQRFDAPAHAFADRVDQHHADLVGRPEDLAHRAPLVDERAVTGQREDAGVARSEEHTSELQSHVNLVCRLLLEKKKHTPYGTRLRRQGERSLNWTITSQDK